MDILKKFFLVALIAALFSFGFTACSDTSDRTLDESMDEEQPAQDQPADEHPTDEHPTVGEHPE